MGLGGLKDAPDIPDARETAGFQTGTNIGTTLLNRALGNTGTSSPFGTTKFKQLGKKNDFVYKDPYTDEKYRIPTFKEVTKLKPKEKEQLRLQRKTETNLLRTARDQSKAIGEHLSTPFQLGAFDFGADLGVDAYTPGGIDAEAYTPGASLDGEVYRGDPLTLGNEATEARLFDLGSKRLDPRFAREQETLQSSLLARGIREGSDAWNAAMGNFNEGRNDAYNSLLLSGRAQAANESMAEWQAGLTGQGQTFEQLLKSRGLSAAEQAQQFGQALQLGQFGMAEQGQQFAQAMADRQRMLAERGQQTGEAFAVRNQPINEIAALLGTGQVTVPQFTGQQQPQAPITDVAGLINKNWEQQFQAWQAESQATQGMLGGLFGAVGNIFASDERIKDKGEVVGQTPEGLDIYEFRIGDGAIQTGVMAQDVEEVTPGAVIETPSGIKAVDYGQVATDGAYTVQKGDNLWKIGQRFGVPVADIVSANAIPNPDLIQPGQTLQIPGLAAPGPEAIPYDPLSSAFLPPETGGVDAVTAALQPANDIDMLTEVDGSGQYLIPPDAGGARPEFPGGGMPRAPLTAQPPGAMPVPPPASPQGGAPPTFDALLEEMFRRRDAGQLQGPIDFIQPDPNAVTPPQPPAMPPPPPIGTVGAGSTGGEFFTPPPARQAAPPPVSPPVSAAPPAPVGTVGAGSTGGEFFTAPPPRGQPFVDPMKERFADAFDGPQSGIIMDLLSAFQNRTMMPPLPGMAPPMRAGVGLGGF